MTTTKDALDLHELLLSERVHIDIHLVTLEEALAYASAFDEDNPPTIQYFETEEGRRFYAVECKHGDASVTLFARPGKDEA